MTEEKCDSDNLSTRRVGLHYIRDEEAETHRLRSLPNLNMLVSKSSDWSQAVALYGRIALLWQF